MTESLRWFVVFCDVDGRSNAGRWLLHRLFPLGYRHCFAFKGQHGGVTIVQLMTGRLQVDFCPGVTAEQYRAELEIGGATVVEMAAEVDDDLWVPRGMTCTSIVRALAGLPSRWQTPRSLARELTRRRADGRRSQEAGDQCRAQRPAPVGQEVGG